MKLTSLGFAIGAILVWSTNAVVAKDALAQLNVAQVLTFQFSSASVVFAIMGRFSTEPRPFLPPPLAIAVGLMGLVGTVALQYLAFAIGPITIVNILTYSWPLLTALAIVGSGASAAPLRLALFSLAGFLGVALLIGSTADWDDQQASIWGYVFATASAGFMAVYSISVSKLNVPPSDLLLPASIFGALATALWWMIGGGGPVTWQSAFSAIYLGLGPMGAGYVLWSYAMKVGPVGPLSTIGYATPVLSTFLLILSGERMTLGAIFASLLIIAACLASGTVSNRKTSRAP